MKKFSVLFLVVAVLVGSASAEVVLSDNFDGADGAAIGTTCDQGGTWGGVNDPAISGNKLSLTNGDYVWANGVSATKDFQADFDYDWTKAWALSTSYVARFDFGLTGNGQYLAKAGSQAGYSLLITANGNYQMTFKLISEYGMATQTATLATGYQAWDHHITLVSDDNLISLYVDDPTMSGTALMSVTPSDVATNPAATNAGYFAFGIGNTSSSIDNLSIQSIPEPATMVTLAFGAIAGLIRRRK